ncbi:unnamed protein product [Ambrosiozyma monospora]|uniref:Unnamed protein product n=1 Tax=Ambrosiozyma monospora TaxID=43982 RepID=A0A9W6YQP8_AMBMO|nr:unnamed protein product [Ambrosiozyma monospora]
MKLQSFFLFGLISLTAVNSIPVASPDTNADELAAVEAKISKIEDNIKSGKINLKIWHNNRFFGRVLMYLNREKKYWEEQIQHQQQSQQQKREIISDSNSYSNGTLPDGYPVAGIIVYASQEDAANPDATPIAIVQGDFGDYDNDGEYSE